MAQEIGETAQQMVKDDSLEVEKILNRRPNGHYWIVIHHKPTKQVLTTGEKIILRVVKDYDVKPKNLLGTIVLEIRDGALVHYEINLHDIPVDWEKVEKKAGSLINPLVQKRTDITSSYFYN